LKAHRGRSLVIAGDHQPAAVHAIAHAINDALGNAGTTVIYTDSIRPKTAKPPGTLEELSDDMNSGAVELLLIVGGNPVYDAPADFDFAKRLDKVALRAHLSLYEDETSNLCHWHLPAAHFLEMWSDAVAFDGTVSIIQPLIAPLYGGRSPHELLSDLTLDASRSAYDLLRDYWRAHWPNPVAGAAFEAAWKKSLNDGLIENSAFKPRSMTVKPPAETAVAGASDELEIVFRTDASVYDGRFANNGWLQELPKALTKLVWGNVALVSPATAERLGVSQDVAGHGGEHGAVETDVVQLNYRGRTVKAPIWIMPGQPDDSITVTLGHGRTRAGHVGNGVGFNAYALRTSEAPWFDSGLKVGKTGERQLLACTQDHHLMEHRHLVRSATLDVYRKNPHFADAPEKTEEKEGIPEVHGHPAISLYPEKEHPYNGYKWGMAIDLTACVGCNGCVIACQAENNIPVVGKEQVTRGREMHWIRLDTYYQGGMENPATHFQPVPCMQCENAPCELVCPVGATVHSDEGLNDMVYNRCVGTRYCSNNCPYKVRRFNFLQYSDYTTPSLKLLNNPDVTVRSRGVMEKCTYCVQRITEARIDADKANRTIRDGEVLTACQAVCPAEAIMFGDLNDPTSRVSKWKAEQLNYTLLEELNTRPRTTYLASLRNPNPAIHDRGNESDAPEDGHA
jgi:molybdopterin-containing oxidoreductase family iron-sulfur binding subunit